MNRLTTLAVIVASAALSATTPADERTLTDEQRAELAKYFGFAPLDIYKLHPGIGQIRLADLNGDGRTDVALWNYTKNRFELFLQPDPSQPKAELSAQPERNEIVNRGDLRNETVAVAYRVAAMDVADLTGDGVNDIVFFGEPKELVILPGKKGGGFGPPDGIRAPDGSPRGGSVAVGDFNGDGKADVALLGDDALSIYSQKPEGGLAPPRRIMHNIKGGQLMLATDLNGDKRDDLLVGVDDKEYGAFAVIQDAAGALGAVRRIRVPDLRSISIERAAGGDHVFCVEAATGQLKHYRWEKPTAASGSADWPQLLYSYPTRSKSKQRPLAVGDVTGDGKQDVVAVDPETAQIVLFRGTADGLEQGAVYPGLVKTLDVQIGDADGDGAMEVISVSREEKMIATSKYQEGRLTFPAPIAVSGAPLAVAVGALKPGERANCLAYLAVDRVGDAETGTWVRVLDTKSGKELASWTVKSLDDDPRGLRFADVNQDGLSDLLLFVNFSPLATYLQTADGKFEPLTGAEAREGLVKEAALEDFDLIDVTGDGKAEVVLVQKSLARALVVKNGRWEVVDQYNPESSDAELKGLAALPGEGGPVLVTYDRKDRNLVVFRRRDDKSYRVDQTIPVGAFDLSALTTVSLGGASSAVLVADAAKLALLFPGQVHATLVEKRTYETKAKDAWLRDCVVGDLNGDGVRDVAVLDTRKATVEILTTARDGELVKATSFQVFQGKRFSDSPEMGIDPREAAIGDVTGDGKNDLILLAHDRLIVYPGQ